MPSDDDSATVTCQWFVKDALKTLSFPAKALNKKSEVDPCVLRERMRSMSDAELAEAYREAVEGKWPLSENAEERVLAVGDTVSLKSGGPLMTIVSIERRKGRGRTKPSRPRGKNS